MALSDPQRKQVVKEFVRNSLQEKPADLTRPQIAAAADALDDYLTTNAVAINLTLPQPFRSTASVAQKSDLLRQVTQARFGG